MKRHAAERGTLVAALFVAVACGARLLAPAAAAATTRESDAEGRQLEALHRAIAERRERVADYERQERGLLEAIQAVDRAALALAAQVGRADRAARQAVQALRSVEQQLGQLTAQVAATRRALGHRAVALYKAGDLGPVRLVFAAGSLRERLARIQALQLLLDHDQVLLARAAQERQSLEETRGKALEATKRRDQALARLAERRAALAEERSTKRHLLAGVRQDRVRERAMLRELEAAAQALEEKIADLQREPGAAPRGFAQRKGALDPPVSGKVLRGFGRVVDAEYHTETFHKGLDFAVEEGEPVRAVAEAVVRFADWFRGYGQVVILDHGGGFFSVSGHLQDIAVAVDETVQMGEIIGHAGETGSLRGPRLYFEIRHGGQALDPEDWLRLRPDL